MALSTSNRLWLLLVMCTFLFTSKLGKAAYEEAHLGAAGVVAEEYVPKAEDADGYDGDAYENYPYQSGGAGYGNYPYQPGGAGHDDPGLVLDKVIECFNDKHIYSSCDKSYRLTEHGYLNVPPEYTDEYCNGPCLKETNHVLDCIYGILQHFVFYNKATVHDVRETIEDGCSYGPKRGNFDVVEHIQADEAITNKSSISVLLLIILGWTLLF